MSADLRDLEAALGYTFRDRDLLVRALTHRSWSEGKSDAAPAAYNEQLEFFGDAILGFLTSETLLARFPDFNEGRLSKLKNYFVSAKHLHLIAQSIGLGSYLQIGRGEEKTGGRAKQALLADALEAIIAAMFLDGGIDVARKFVVGQIVREGVEPPGDDHVNYRELLEEQSDARRLAKPRYTVVAQSGPPHERRFVVEARVGNGFTARGEGSSKKAAGQQAAKGVLEQFGRET